jgi:hypothetical protein
LDEEVYARSILGEGSLGLMVEALSTEAMLVSLSLSLLFSETSEAAVLVDGMRLFFCSSCGLAGSMLVRRGSGCGAGFSLRGLSFENIDLFSVCVDVSFRDTGPGLALRGSVVDELIGVEF